jgi:hypothetical protein
MHQTINRACEYGRTSYGQVGASFFVSWLIFREDFAFCLSLTHQKAAVLLKMLVI